MPKFESLRPVAQEDEWGCGVACVASILGWSYGRAKDLLEIYKGGKIDQKTQEGKGLLLHHIALALQKQNYHVVADWDEPERYKPGTIVLVGVEDGPVDQEHYIVRTADRRWMDPWINYPKRNVREAGLRDDFPPGKTFFVALVPKASSKPR